MVKMIDNYSLKEVLGEGNFGKVYRAKHETKSGEFAIKIIPVEKFNQIKKLEECTLNEVKTLSIIGPCEHIVRYYEMLKTKNNYYFVYEYCNGGTLLQAIYKEGHFSQNKAIDIFKQLLQAFKILNKLNIMHRDLKSENVFFSNGRIKLGDFGFCKGLKADQKMAQTMLGSPIYMAPQVLIGQKYSTKADVWSLGVILYEMLYGNCPFQSNSIGMLINTITKTQLNLRQEINHVSQKTKTLIRSLLTKDYCRRISWVELFNYEWNDQTEKLKQGESQIRQNHKSFSVIKELQFQNMNNEKTKLSFLRDYVRNSEPFSQKMEEQIREKQKQKGLFVSQNYMNYIKDKKVRNQKYSPSPKEMPTNSDLKRNQHEKKSQKRIIMLEKHESCLKMIKQALRFLEDKGSEGLCEMYIVLKKVHNILKSITEEIKITEIELLDVVSLVNFEIIQVDRQLIETRQELMRIKQEIPKLNSDQSPSILSFISQQI